MEYIKENCVSFIKHLKFQCSRVSCILSVSLAWEHFRCRLGDSTSGLLTQSLHVNENSRYYRCTCHSSQSPPGMECHFLWDRNVKEKHPRAEDGRELSSKVITVGTTLSCHSSVKQFTGFPSYHA